MAVHNRGGDAFCEYGRTIALSLGITGSQCASVETENRYDLPAADGEAAAPQCSGGGTIEAMRIPNILERAEFRSEKMAKCDLVRGQTLSAGLNCFEPGQEHKPHVHEGQDKLYYVLEGEGSLTIGEDRSHFQAGDLAIAPSGVVHSLRNSGQGKLVVLVVFAPPPPEKA